MTALKPASAEVIGPDDLREYLRATNVQQKVIPASAFAAEVAREMFAAEKPDQIVLPWASTHGKFAFRPGEVTLWAGINGHGKSLILSQVVLSLCAQGQRACVASFEMKPWRQLERMLRQASCGDSPTEEWLEAFCQWTDGKLWFYDQQGTARIEWVFALVRYCAERLKITHIVIDSLMKCVAGEDDMNGQKAFVDELTALARDHNVHIHLVHHVRKQGSERDRISKFDVKGSGAITDQVDNVLLVWRNKAKEADDKRAGEPDCLLTCDKQRNGEWEGSFSFWFHRGAMQFVSDSNGRAMDLLRLSD